VGAPVLREAPDKFFLVVPFHFFGSKGTINRFGERFRDGQYSFVSFFCLLFYSRYLRAQPFVKVEALAPPWLMESAPLNLVIGFPVFWN